MKKEINLKNISFITLFKYLRWAVIGAMVTTSIAVSLIIYGSYLDFESCTRHVDYPDIVMSKFFMCFGTVMFAYGGHGAFPTIQHDMKRPYHFKRAVWLAFLSRGFGYKFSKIGITGCSKSNKED